MKKRFLKFKIAMTNISRVIMSFLFVNVGYLFQNSVQAVNNQYRTPTPTELIGEEIPDLSCYIAGPPRFELKVFIIAVPIVLAIALVLFIIVKKKKSKKKKEEENKEK